MNFLRIQWIRHRSSTSGTIVKIYNLNTQEHTKLGGLPQTHFDALESLSTSERDKLEETSFAIPTECIVAMKRDPQEKQVVLVQPWSLTKSITRLYPF